MTDKEQRARELLPCPFCGGKALDNGAPIGVRGNISCLECGALGPMVARDHPEVAATRWNTRPALTDETWRGMETESFQARVRPWMMACFGPEIAADRMERNHRFLEEALELVQALGCTKSEALQLVDYTYGRAEGEPLQEVGGVMVTLAALCLATDMNMHRCGEAELARINAPHTMEKIRAKQAAKPKHSPLPSPPVSGEGV